MNYLYPTQLEGERVREFLKETPDPERWKTPRRRWRSRLALRLLRLARRLDPERPIPLSKLEPS